MAADGCGLDAGSATKAEAFAALHRRLDRAGAAPLAVGLSGGSDSLALLLLALEWARGVGRPVLALTVDHGLNPESKRWTAQAGAAARALGAGWRALNWSGAKPSTGLPASARRARHALLAEATRAAGARVLLLGHTADDVAESELIRRETPTHGRLREWAPSPVWPDGRGVFLLRPLLGVRRDALRSMLAVRGLSWLEDPANTDPRSARARARASLERARQSRTSRSSGEGQDRGRWPVWDSLEPGPSPSPSPATYRVRSDGVVSLGLKGVCPARLARAICCAAGRETPPTGSAVERLVLRVAAGETGVVTLGGARVVRDGDAVTLCRELGRRPPEPAAVEPGKPLVFDGRFEITADAPGWRVAALTGHAARLTRADRRRLAGILACARPALPVLLDATGAPHLPRPFGEGLGEALELVSARLAAAFGRIDTERDLARWSGATTVHGA